MRIGQESEEFSHLAKIRVINTKLLLNAIEELMVKPEIESILSSNKRPNMVKTTREILQIPELQSTLRRLQTRVQPKSKR